MANPQIEDGYLKIANEILDALARTRIPGEARQVLDAIIRLTYGWNRKKAQITYRDFKQLTGLLKQNIYRALTSLSKHNFIEHCEEGFCFLKDHKKWIPFTSKSNQKRLQKRVIKSDYSNQKRLQKVIKSDYKQSSKLITTTPSKALSDKDSQMPKYNKDNKDKDISLSLKKNDTDPRVKHIMDYFHNLIVTEKGFKPTIDGADAVAVKRALRDITEDEIKDAVRYYLNGSKAKEHGLTLSIALSKHSLNLYKENWEKVKWQYDET